MHLVELAKLDTMAKKKTVFICSNCGYESLKWAGKCPECGRWNSFEESETAPANTRETPRQSQTVPVKLTEIGSGQEQRLLTGISELDRVLGGGIIPASVVLIAGDPGIGKSTLLLQMAGALTARRQTVLYVSGEESLKQIRGRAERLELDRSAVDLMAETELENILYQIRQLKPQIVIIDSIQSVYSQNVSGAPGNVSQVRECTSRLFRDAKENGWTLFIIGHITKEGSISGPKILEHTVDVVIYFEGDNLYRYRLLRSLKNRFGATNEIGLFLMEKSGLREVENPSLLFLPQNEGLQTGSGVVCSFEGSRPLLAEVQALVSRANYGVPQRTVSGFDQRRLALLLAILEKHCGLNFGYSDVFVKIAGGLRIDDPGIDLGIALAVYSSFADTPLQENSIYIGEIGLNGDVRAVSQLDRRIGEAVKLGFKNIYIPSTENGGPAPDSGPDCRLMRIRHISELIQRRPAASGYSKKEF